VGAELTDCVFDIETAPLEDAAIPAAFVEKLQDPEDPQAWREQLGLYALSASVVAIAMLNPRTNKGEILYDNRHGDFTTIALPQGIEAKLTGGSEREMLERFWSAVPKFDRVVTFNGRGFDVPFLMQRSLILEVAVTVNLMPPRFNMRSSHLDLAELLSQFRATRPYGLEAWSQAIGAASPKAGEVSGAQVGEYFHAGKVQPILEYCMRDVVATATLAARAQRLWGLML
jgi:predicted PolB exonuclease-like 3'-5' exonuclease